MSEPAISALFVEDDRGLARLTIEYLQNHGIIVAHQATGTRGLAEALRTRYDVVLLDIMLPEKNGLDVCRELRQQSDVPIILLTARGEEADRVMGLETGADDYVAKPFSPRELLARIQAVVRRARGKAGPANRPVQASGILVDPFSRRVTLNGKEVPLTGHEFSLLRVLVERAGRVLSREQLMELATGTAEDAFDRSIDVHISRIRQKLGDDSRHPRLLKTIRGAGYVLVREGQ